MNLFIKCSPITSNSFFFSLFSFFFFFLSYMNCWDKRRRKFPCTEPSYSSVLCTWVRNASYEEWISSLAWPPKWTHLQTLRGTAWGSLFLYCGHQSSFCLLVSITLFLSLTDHKNQSLTFNFFPIQIARQSMPLSYHFSQDFQDFRDFQAIFILPNPESLLIMVFICSFVCFLQTFEWPPLF